MYFTTTPDRIVVAGDWHGNANWAGGVIALLRGLLPDEPRRVLLHLGDFGIWAGREGRHYLETVENALRAADAELWFIDGNHENFNLLRRYTEDPEVPASVEITPSVRWLTRGHRWEWHYRHWLALGGGVSVDRATRQNRISWWPEERITEAQAKRIVADGPADVMVCHDAPSSVPIVYPHPAPATWHPADVRASDQHRVLLQAVVEEIRPTHLFHGHHHMEQDITIQLPHGPVAVTGLAADGAVSGNYRVLDIRTMQWCR